MSKDSKVSKTFRVLCIILLCFLIFFIVNFIVNYEKYGVVLSFVSGLVCLGLILALIKPVFFGQYSYPFKLINKPYDAKNRFSELVFLGIIVLIFSYGLIKISINPNRFETPTLVFLYFVCVYAIVQSIRLMFYRKKDVDNELNAEESNKQ